MTCVKWAGAELNRRHTDFQTAQNPPENPPFYPHKPFVFNRLDPIGFILLHCNSMKNTSYSSAKIWACPKTRSEYPTTKYRPYQEGDRSIEVFIRLRDVTTLIDSISRNHNASDYLTDARTISAPNSDTSKASAKMDDHLLRRKNGKNRGKVVGTKLSTFPILPHFNISVNPS